MTSQLTLYNGALLVCGERKLASLSEDRPPRKMLDTVWDSDAVKDCLEKGQWNFAMRSVEIEYSPSITPTFGYQYAFDRPTDLIRPAAICSDEYFQVPLLRYQTEGAYWFADIDPIYVRYVADGASYGDNYAAWPGNFTRYVECYLASRIIGRLTKDEKEWMRVRQEAKDALTSALSTDAMEQPTQMLPAGSWVRSRRGRGTDDRGSTSNLIG